MEEKKGLGLSGGETVRIDGKDYVVLAVSGKQGLLYNPAHRETVVAYGLSRLDGQSYAWEDFQYCGALMERVLDQELTGTPTPLALFARNEADYRLEQILGEEGEEMGVSSECLAKYLEDMKRAVRHDMEQFLFHDENALAHDAMDEIVRNCVCRIVETAKVFSAVDEALQTYGTDIVSVDTNAEDNSYVDVNLSFGSSNDPFREKAALYGMCDASLLKEGLNSRKVSCFLW